MTLEQRIYMLSHSFFVQDEGTLKWKDVDPNVVFEIVWRSPWRMWEYVNKEQYKDGNVYVVGHVYLHKPDMKDESVCAPSLCTNNQKVNVQSA